MKIGVTGLPQTDESGMIYGHWGLLERVKRETDEAWRDRCGQGHARWPLKRDFNGDFSRHQSV